MLINKRMSYLQIVESYHRRFERNGFLVGDLFKFNKDFKKHEDYNKLGNNVKELLDQMIESGLNVRVVGIKDTTSPIYPGNPQTSSLDVVLTIALDNGGGRYTHYVAIPSHLGQPEDTYPNLTPIPDAWKRDNNEIITPEELKQSDHPSNKSDRGDGKLTPSDIQLPKKNKKLNESMYKNDQDLLTEAYELTKFKQHLPNLTLKTLTEGKLTNQQEELATKVILELFGGLRNVAGGLGSAAKGVAQGLGRAVTGSGKALAAGAKQFGSNVKGMYQTGEQVSKSSQRDVKLNEVIEKIKVILQQHIQQHPKLANLIKGKPVEQLTLKQIQDAIKAGRTSAINKNRLAQSKGALHGVGTAMSSAF